MYLVNENLKIKNKKNEENKNLRDLSFIKHTIITMEISKEDREREGRSDV